MKMIDITNKNSTYREAIATAVVKVGKMETIQSVEKNEVPKGNVFEMAKTAGLLGVKQTHHLLPDCHPVPIEQTSVNFELKGLEIHIEMKVSTIYKTGVEVEAMHGVSVVALTIYDMLKPLDKEIEISSIRLLKKKGGKSDFDDKPAADLRAAVIVCSDTVSAKQKEDKAGKLIKEKLKSYGLSAVNYSVVPDEKEEIIKLLNKYVEMSVDLIIFSGGTGLSTRDVTPESVAPLFDRDIPGIMEAARTYGQQRTPYSMLSRGVAGVKGKSLILTLPGSSNGAKETMDALFPSILHIFKIFRGARHD